MRILGYIKGWVKNLPNKRISNLALVYEDCEIAQYGTVYLKARLSGVKLGNYSLGGAATLDDIKGLVKRYGIVGAAAGSLFVFKGKYKAVLINYPMGEEKKSIFQ